MADDRRRDLRFLHFVCPECGISDREFGELAHVDDAHCFVCHMDDGRIVRLRQWAAQDEGDTASS